VKNIKYFALIIMCFILSGCSKDFYGTWCLYTETPSSLVVLNNDVSDNDINNLKNYITKNITDLKSYDVIDSIENSNKMITIYYNSSENIANYQDKISSMSGVESVTQKNLNTTVEELDITNSSYSYGAKLDTLYAFKTDGTYKAKGNVITLDSNKKFYYKNNYLCYDENCDQFLIKSTSDTCDNN
jgi:hypothetical protein